MFFIRVGKVESTVPKKQASKQRRAFRLVFYIFLVGASEAQYQKKGGKKRGAEIKLHCRTLYINAMSCCVPFPRCPLAIVMPYSRGGRIEAQHNFIKFDQFFDFSPKWTWGPLDRLKILS